MSGPVDVLAAMDAAIKGAEAPVRERRGHRNGLIEARAAVAELIEAAEQAHAYLSATAPATATEYRLRCAIARAQGGRADG